MKILRRDQKTTSPHRRSGYVPQGTWTHGDALAATATRWLLIIAVGCGPVALGMSMTAPRTRPAAAATTSASASSTQREMACEHAATFLITWLTATKGSTADKELAQALGESWAVTLPEHAAAVANVAVASATDRGSGIWSIVVGVDVTDAGASTATHRYYRVLVRYSIGRDNAHSPSLTVLAQPAPAPAPRILVGGPDGYNSMVVVTAPVGTVVTGFLTAYLTGQSDGLQPYTAPNAKITAIRPAAAREVLNVALAVRERDSDLVGADVPADGTQVTILAAADLVDRAGQTRGAHFFLTLTARSGRWEVSSTDATPVVDATGQTVRSSTSTASNGTSTSASPSPTDGAPPVSVPGSSPTGSASGTSTPTGRPTATPTPPVPPTSRPVASSGEVDQ